MSIPYDASLAPQGDSQPAEPAPGWSTAAAALRQGDFHTRWDAVKQISGSDEQGVAALLGMLQDNDLDWDTRWFAARSLGKFDRPDVIATLIEAFRTTDDDDLRQALGEALTQIGPSAVVVLTELLPQATHRRLAVQALARIHHPATIAPLLTAKDDPQIEVRATVLEALTQFVAPDFLPVVVAALSDPAAPVRLAAIRGLISLKRYISPDQWVTWLEPCLWDRHLAVAQQAGQALGRQPSAAATQGLLTLLHTPNTPVALQIVAIQALSWQGTPLAIEGLLGAWEITDPTGRIAIVQGLGKLAFTAVEVKGSAAISARLAQWLNDLPATATNSPLRRHLVVAIGQLGVLAEVPCLQRLLTDDDEGVRIHAEVALQWLGVTQQG
ncbi:MAG: HEAT repeat domain-containing protein [Nodosilinea sp.]